MNSPAERPTLNKGVLLVAALVALGLLTTLLSPSLPHAKAHAARITAVNRAPSVSITLTATNAPAIPARQE